MQPYTLIITKKNGKQEWKSAFARSEDEAKAKAISECYANARDFASKSTTWRRQCGWDNLDIYQRSAMAKGYSVFHCVIEK